MPAAWTYTDSLISTSRGVPCDCMQSVLIGPGLVKDGQLLVALADAVIM